MERRQAHKSTLPLYTSSFVSNAPKRPLKAGTTTYLAIVFALVFIAYPVMMIVKVVGDIGQHEEDVDVEYKERPQLVRVPEDINRMKVRKLRDYR